MSSVHIRATEFEDIEGLCELMNLPNYRFGTLRLPFHSIEDAKRRFKRSQSRDVVSIVAVQDDKIVGTAALYKRSGRERHIGNIGMGVHDDYQGQGIGRKLMEALIDQADKWLNLRRLELTVYSDNERAVGLYKSLGFEVEGHLRDAAFRDGAYVDSLIMGRIHKVD